MTAQDRMQLAADALDLELESVAKDDQIGLRRQGVLRAGDLVLDSLNNGSRLRRGDIGLFQDLEGGRLHGHEGWSSTGASIRKCIRGWRVLHPLKVAQT